MSQHDDGPLTGDAFGQMLLDCLDDGGTESAVPEIIERSDGLILNGPAARYFAPYERWGELEWWACARVHGRVLDVGAGAGRHALHFQAAGHDVVALDLSPLALEVCRRRGCATTFVGTVDDLATSGPGRFDTFLLMGNNFGLLRDRDHGPRFLATLASMANPGASVLGTCMDPYATDNPLHLAYHEANRAAGRMGGQIRMRMRHRRLATPWIDYLFLTPDELRAIVAPSPWEVGVIEHQGPRYAAELRLRR